MKIAIIHNQFNRSGGMETYMLNLVHGFLATGDEVHIHTYQVDGHLAAAMGVTVHAERLFYLPRRLKKYAFLGKMNRHFDRHRFDMTLSLTRTACQDMAVVGGIHPESVLQAGRRNWYRRQHDDVETAFEREMFARVPAIVAHSRRIQVEIGKHYPVDPNKIHVLYPPVDEQIFHAVDEPVRMDLRRAFNLPENKLCLLFPSMGHKRKGLYQLIDAIRSLESSRFELVIVGEPVRGAKLPANVRALGYVRQMADLYRAADYCVLPSSYEPFGLVVAESLQCGTPVLTTAQVGASELLGEEEGVVLADNCRETLVAALDSLEKKRVPQGFAGRNGLEIGQHVQSLKQLAQTIRATE